MFPARHWGEVRDLTKSNGQRLSPTERRQAEHDLDVRIRQAAAAAKRAGKFGAALREMVEIATDRVDWRDKFRMAFDGVLRGEVSWARPNRRFIRHGVYLPGWRRTGAGRIAFVLDTSGSISAAELSVYTAAVLGILEETGPEAVALIQCDAEVQRVDTIQPGESFDRIEVHGRGGHTIPACVRLDCRVRLWCGRDRLRHGSALQRPAAGPWPASDLADADA